MRAFVKRHLVLFILCSFNLMGYGQIMITRKDSLLADLLTLKDSLTASYPSLYLHNSPAKIDLMFSDAAGRIDNHTTDIRFFNHVKSILSGLKDGHLYAKPSASISKQLETDRVFIPLRLHFDGKSALLVHSLSKECPVGTELLRINGQTISAIRTELFKYIVGDGDVISKKTIILNNVFHFYYLLAYGKQTQFKILLRTPDGTVTEKIVQAVSEADIPASISSGSKEKLLTFEITKDKIAIMCIRSFDQSALSEEGLDFPRFLESAFGQLHQRKINKLIIDLRDNGGGRDLYGALLYRYLASGPFRYYRQLSAVTDKLPYQEFSKNVSSFNDLSPALLNKTANGFILKPKAHSNLALQRPFAHPYARKLLFMINGLTFSTAAEFCAIAKSNSRGLFVGQETGGAIEGNTSGVQAKLILPNTKITVSFGLIRYQMAINRKHMGRGIMPDYLIIPTLYDIIAHKDAELDFALNLFRKKRG